MKLSLMILVMFLSNTSNAANLVKEYFSDISQLVGDWQGRYQSGSQHTVNYQLIANDSVLVETWQMSPTRISMTTYAIDGDRLLATHYCPQGNQPRLALVERDEQQKFQFRFINGTNLKDSKNSHQHAFWLKINSPTSFTRSETYLKSFGKILSEKDEGEAVVYRRTTK